MPDLYIIMGSNGAGKSTVGLSYLPEVIQENHTVFDVDRLANFPFCKFFILIGQHITT